MIANNDCYDAMTTGLPFLSYVSLLHKHQLQSLHYHMWQLLISAMSLIIVIKQIHAVIPCLAARPAYRDSPARH